VESRAQLHREELTAFFELNRQKYRREEIHNQRQIVIRESQITPQKVNQAARMLKKVTVAAYLAPFSWLEGADIGRQTPLHVKEPLWKEGICDRG